MAAPTFVGAGTGVVVQTGSAAITKACTAGNIVIAHVFADGTGADWSFGSASNIEGLSGTDSTIDVARLDAPVGSPTAAHQSILIGRSLGGTASVTLTVGPSGNDLYARLYEFSGVHTGTTLSAVVENSTAGTLNNSVGTTNKILSNSVTTLGADRLAVNFVAVNDDNAVGDFAAETGGNWVEAVAEYAVATGTDGCIQLQTATMASAGTISGGEFTMGASDSWGVVGTAFIPAVVADPNPPYPTVKQYAVTRSYYI